MEPEEKEQLEKEKKVLEEQLAFQRKERNKKIIIWGVAVVLIILVTWVAFRPYIEEKAIEKEEEQIALEEEIELNASIAAAEAARLAAIAAEERRDELEEICEEIFDDSMDDYDDYIFDTKAEALEWITEDNEIRTDRTKTFEERVNYQIRYAVMFAKLNQVTLPIAIAVGDADSNNINESQGLVCINSGVITLGKGGTDNLLYQITMRREWV